MLRLKVDMRCRVQILCKVEVVDATPAFHRGRNFMRYFREDFTKRDWWVLKGVRGVRKRLPCRCGLSGTSLYRFP